MSHNPPATRTYTAAEAKRALIPLDFIFILSILCLQAFSYIFQQVGADLGAPNEAPLIVSIPGIILGIVCFIYGSLSDFVSLKKMVAAGVGLLFAGSLMGFFLHGNIWLVIAARCLQTAGGQVAGSVYLAIASRYLKGSEQVTFFGIFTASYQLSTAIGVVASGFLSTIDWALLFLVPLLGVLVLPMLMRSIPEVDARETKVDVAGFTIFGIMIALLTLFFSYGVPFLVGAAAMLVVFVVYINRAKDPFITPAFFRNSRWVRAILLILLVMFTDYSITGLFNGVGADVYGISASEASLYLAVGAVVACVVACSSGKIMEKLGRSATIYLAAILEIVGLVSAALFVSSGILLFAAGIWLYYGCIGLIYAPLTTMTLGTLDASEMGRGVGMNDLAVSVTASIGIAIFGGIMGTTALSGVSVIGATAQTATYSNLLLIYAGTILLAIIAYTAFRSTIKPEER